VGRQCPADTNDSMRIAGLKMLKMNRAAMVVTAALVAAMAGCGGGGEQPGDVLIIVPDYGQADVVADSVVTDEGSVDRDVSGQDLAGDTSVTPDTATDEGAADEGGIDTAVTTDEGVDTMEDVGPRCSLGKAACNSLSADRKTCDTASVLGRTILATDNAVSFTTNTINEDTGGNKNDDELNDDGCPWFPGDDAPLWCQSKCEDAGLDHFMRVYLIPGDYFSLSVSDYLVYDKYGTNIDFMLKVYRGNACPLDRDVLVSCIDDKGEGDGRTNIEVVQIKPLTEQEAGWYTIVLDSVNEEHAGTYTLEARLFQNSEYTGEWDLCCDYPLE